MPDWRGKVPEKKNYEQSIKYIGWRASIPKTQIVFNEIK